MLVVVMVIQILATGLFVILRLANAPLSSGCPPYKLLVKLVDGGGEGDIGCGSVVLVSGCVGFLCSLQSQQQQQ